MADNDRYPEAWGILNRDKVLSGYAQKFREAGENPDYFVRVRLVPIDDYKRMVNRIACPIICWWDECCCAAVLDENYEPSIYCESGTGPYCRVCWDQLCMESE